MPTNNVKIIKIHHRLGDVVFQPKRKVRKIALANFIRDALDLYADEESKATEAMHQKMRLKGGDYYETPGYNLQLYRRRACYTQVQLAAKTGIKQHHISEMEKNKRSIGKKLANKLADALHCDYHEFL